MSANIDSFLVVSNACSKNIRAVGLRDNGVVCEPIDIKWRNGKDDLILGLTCGPIAISFLRKTTRVALDFNVTQARASSSSFARYGIKYSGKAKRDRTRNTLLSLISLSKFA